VNSLFATDTQRKGDLPPRPGPEARLVGRPRVTASVMWAYIGLIGAALVAFGGVVGAIFGAFMLLVFALGVASLARSRVWIDGPVLYHRNVRGMQEPMRLDRLRRAELSAFGRNSGRQLLLHGADGTVLTIDATNLRLVRLYKALAEFIPPSSPVANELLQKRMGKHRPPSLGLT
jgi:hypothetical protein